MLVFINRVWAAPAAGKLWGPGLQDPVPHHLHVNSTVPFSSKAPNTFAKTETVILLAGKRPRVDSVSVAPWWETLEGFLPLPSSVAHSEGPVSPSEEGGLLTLAGIMLENLARVRQGGGFVMALGSQEGTWVRGLLGL